MRAVAYHFTAKVVSFGKGQSAVHTAAYNARQQLQSERSGRKTNDYSRYSELEFSGIFAPKDAPAWAQDREQLWNRAEAAERRKDGQPARNLEFAFPHQLDRLQREWLIKDFVREQFVRKGMIADVNIHAPHPGGDQRNWHAHVLLSMRELDGENFAKTKNTDWNQQERVLEWREKWAQMSARALERAGYELEAERWRHGHKDIEAQREAARERGDLEYAEGVQAHATKHRGPQMDAALRREMEAEAQIDTAYWDIDPALSKAKAELAAVEKQIRAEEWTPEAQLDQITRNRSTFTREELDRELVKTFDDEGARKQSAERVLAVAGIVALTPEGEQKPRYTTESILETERHALRAAQALAEQTDHDLKPGKVGRFIDDHEKYKTLTQEQLKAVWRCVGHQGLAMIDGQAGTGKSHTMNCVRELYEDQGYRVIGLSPTNAVTQDMKEEGFSNGKTLHAELWALDKDRTAWDRRTVVMVDEAAMIDTRNLARLTAHAQEAGAKLILIGDDRQLSSIERGGVFSVLKERHGGAELSEVRRQHSDDDRRASELMAEGKFREALDSYQQKGAIHWTATQEQAGQQLIDQWVKDSAAAPEKTRMVFAYTNRDVDMLNGALRQVRVERGELGEAHSFETKHGAAEFATGDRIQFTATDKPQGIYNGQAGTLQKIEGDRLTVLMDGKKPRTVEFSAQEFDGFRHAYAGTIYKGQGRTLQQSYLLHTDEWRATSSYVALTRHAEKLELFTSKETARNIKDLAWQMSRLDDRRAATHFMEWRNQLHGDARPLTSQQLNTWLEAEDRKRDERLRRAAPAPDLFHTAKHEIGDRETEADRQRREQWSKRLEQLAKLNAGAKAQLEHSEAQKQKPEAEPAPADLSPTAAAIYQAMQRSDNAPAFAAALQDQGMSLARVTKQEAQASEQEAAEAKRQGSKAYVAVYKEAEIVVVNDAAHVYRLNQRNTGHTPRELAKFMNGIDPKSLPSLSAAKQTMIERAEQFEIERQLFRDLSGVGVLKRDTKSDSRKAPTAAPRQASAQPVKAAATKTAAAALDFVGDVVAAIFSFFDTPREMSPGEIRGLIEKQLERQEQINWQRIKDDQYYRTVEATRQAQEFAIKNQIPLRENERDYRQRY